MPSFRGLLLRACSATAAPRAMPEAGRLGRRALPVLRASATISRSSRADCSAGSLLDLHVRSRSCRGAAKGSQQVKRLGCASLECFVTCFTLRAGGGWQARQLERPRQSSPHQVEVSSASYSCCCLSRTLLAGWAEDRLRDAG